LETYHEITVLWRVAPLEFVGERNRVIGANADDPSKGPFFVRPIFSGKKGCLVTSRHHCTPHAPQVSFRPAPAPNPPPHESDVQFLGRLSLDAVRTNNSSHVG